MKDRVDELVDVYNEIAEMLGKDKEDKEPLTTSHAELDAADISEEVCTCRINLYRIMS